MKWGTGRELCQHSLFLKVVSGCQESLLLVVMHRKTLKYLGLDLVIGHSKEPSEHICLLPLSPYGLTSAPLSTLYLSATSTLPHALYALIHLCLSSPSGFIFSSVICKDDRGCKNQDIIVWEWGCAGETTSCPLWWSGAQSNVSGVGCFIGSVHCKHCREWQYTKSGDLIYVFQNSLLYMLYMPTPTTSVAVLWIASASEKSGSVLCPFEQV